MTTDIPADNRHRFAPRSGVAFDLSRGARLTLIDVQRQQLADLHMPDIDRPGQNSPQYNAQRKQEKDRKAADLARNNG